MTAAEHHDGLALFRRGSGERVLWLHGYTLDSTIWGELWDRLPGFEHVGLDLPGHGASRPWAPHEDLESLGRRIGGVATELGARRLVGLSFGGMVALAVAAEMGDRLDALVLGSPGVAGGPTDRDSMTCNLDLQRLADERGLGDWLRERWMSSPPDIFSGAARRPELFQRLREVVGRHSWEELRNEAMRGITQSVQSSAALRRVRADTLIVLGDRDMGSFKRCGELIRRQVPRCRRVYLPGAGHLGLLECPGEAADLIAAHLRP